MEKCISKKKTKKTLTQLTIDGFMARFPVTKYRNTSKRKPPYRDRVDKLVGVFGVGRTHQLHGLDSVVIGAVAGNHIPEVAPFVSVNDDVFGEVEAVLRRWGRLLAGDWNLRGRRLRERVHARQMGPARNAE